MVFTILCKINVLICNYLWFLFNCIFFTFWLLTQQLMNKWWRNDRSLWWLMYLSNKELLPKNSLSVWRSILGHRCSNRTHTIITNKLVMKLCQLVLPSGQSKIQLIDIDLSFLNLFGDKEHFQKSCSGRSPHCYISHNVV